MPNLDEKQVQTWSLHYLHSKYQTSPEFVGLPIFADAELDVVKTAGEIWVGRADGLICIKLNEDKFFTIALEAKSKKTQNDFLKFVDKGDAELSTTQNVVSAAILVLPALIALIATWSFAWYWILFSVVLIGFLSLLLLGLYGERPSFFKSNVHIQLETYPGNERWIALPDEAWNLLNDQKKVKKFIGICKNYKYGILIVKSNGEVLCEYEPVRLKGDFINKYVKADKIKSSLNQKALSNLSYIKCKMFLKDNLINSIECANPKSYFNIP